MIIGIGIDIVEIARIEKIQLRTYGRLAERILGPDELFVFRRRQYSPKRAIKYLATRFAAKEAFSKATGLGMRQPITWHNIQILNVEKFGIPKIICNGALNLWVSKYFSRFHISLTDEHKTAIAFVIAERD